MRYLILLEGTRRFQLSQISAAWAKAHRACCVGWATRLAMSVRSAQDLRSVAHAVEPHRPDSVGKIARRPCEQESAEQAILPTLRSSRRDAKTRPYRRPSATIFRAPRRATRSPTPGLR